MSKAYDRVNLYMLNQTMIRLKFPSTCRQMILSLFTDRYNQVITADGLTDPYKVLVGIDQGEVISLLLWCIYYDPLLCEVHSHTNIGYRISHTWFTNIQEPTNTQTLEE